jgi:hypothetical protein
MSSDQLLDELKLAFKGVRVQPNMTSYQASVSHGFNEGNQEISAGRLFE